MAQGMKPSTYRKLGQRDNILDRIITDLAASRGIKLTDELPPLPTQADILKKAGARVRA